MPLYQVAYEERLWANVRIDYRKVKKKKPRTRSGGTGLFGDWTLHNVEEEHVEKADALHQRRHKAEALAHRYAGVCLPVQVRPPRAAWGVQSRAWETHSEVRRALRDGQLLDLHLDHFLLLGLLFLRLLLAQHRFLLDCSLRPPLHVVLRARIRSAPLQLARTMASQLLIIEREAHGIALK